MPAEPELAMVMLIATVVSSLAVAATALLIFFQLRRLRQSQQVSAILTLYDRSTTPEMLQAASWLKSKMPENFSYDEYIRDHEARQKLERLWYYFEFLGVLVNRGYLPSPLVFDQQGSFIAGVWDKSQHLIHQRRDERKSPQYMENFEIMRNAFRSWAQGEKPKLDPKRTRAYADYYKGEYRLPTGAGQ